MAGIGSDAREVRATGVVFVPCAPASVAVARRRLTADLSAAGVFGQAVGDAALVISELLSNAIKHAWPLPDAKLQVAWAVDHGSVKVAVSDGGGPTRPQQAFPAASSVGGRGLGIVEQLSDDWGVKTDDDGLTVWAVLPAPGSGGGPGGVRRPVRPAKPSPPRPRDGSARRETARSPGLGALVG